MGSEQAGWQPRLFALAGVAIAVLHARFQGGTVLRRGATPPEPQEEVVIFLSVAPIVVREAVDRSVEGCPDEQHASRKAHWMEAARRLRREGVVLRCHSVTAAVVQDGEAVHILDSEVVNGEAVVLQQCPHSCVGECPTVEWQRVHLVHHKQAMTHPEAAQMGGKTSAKQ